MVVLLIDNNKKAKTKRRLIEAIEESHANVFVKPTSGRDEYAGPLSGLPDGMSLCFCGPDGLNPRYYGRLKREGDRIIVY